MKKSLLLAALALSLAACDIVPPGYSAVKVNRYGDDRGVEPTVVGPGRYWFGLNVDYYKFPTFMQTDKWQEDQAITFQASGGLPVTAGIGISYAIEQTNVAKVFQTYRRGIDEISDSYLRNMVRDSFNNLGTKYDVEKLYGDGKQALLNDVTLAVKKEAAEAGITVRDISYITSLTFPPTVVAAINAKIQATQEAMRVENEVRKTEAEQRKLVVAAESQVKVAEAEAKAIKARGEALRASPEALRLKELENQTAAIEKWNGALPTYNGLQAVPFMNLK
jgi:regulator of protease activity HflC (stomatin/prohibitin superfamily)